MCILEALQAIPNIFKSFLKAHSLNAFEKVENAFKNDSF